MDNGSDDEKWEDFFGEFRNNPSNVLFIVSPNVFVEFFVEIFNA